MDLTNLSDRNLLLATEALDQKERETFTQLLHHLREIERRRLYSSLECTSLFDYLVSHLKCSESAANRRISSMRLMRDLPEIEEKIISGELSPTNLVLAQALFSKEKKSGRRYTPSQKSEVLSQLENQTTRSAQKIVSEINPDMKKRNRFDFEAIEDEALRSKLLRVKGRLAHPHPQMNLYDLLHYLCDAEIGRKTKSPPAPEVGSQAEVRRQVWRRDRDKCSWCGSTHALEIDHILPRAVGGLSTFENMRLLCRSCNQRAAIEYFGQKKMDSFLRSPFRRYG